MVGHDADREALRSFRLSRIESDVRKVRPASRGPDFEVPGDFDPGEVFPTAGEPEGAPRPWSGRRSRRPAWPSCAAPSCPARPGRRPVALRLPVGDGDGLLAWALGNEAEIVEPGLTCARWPAAGWRPGPGWSGHVEPGPHPRAGAAGRVQRLLAMVPWVLTHPGAAVDEVCERFGIDPRHARRRPGPAVRLRGAAVRAGRPDRGLGRGRQGPHRLADYFSRAPRLTWREAAGLYLAGRALARLPGFDEQGALDRALKLEAGLPAEQVGRIQELAGRVSVDLEGDPVERATGPR